MEQLGAWVSRLTGSDPVSPSMTMADQVTGTHGVSLNLSLRAILSAVAHFIWPAMAICPGGRSGLSYQVDQSQGVRPPRPDLPLIHTLKLAVDDLHAYYRAAALAQPGPSPTVHGIASWFWGDTAAGRLIHEVKRAILQRGNPTEAAVAYLLFVPFEHANNEVDIQKIGSNFAALRESREL